VFLRPGLVKKENARVISRRVRGTVRALISLNKASHGAS
jgi:hypothetical protein